MEHSFAQPLFPAFLCFQLWMRPTDEYQLTHCLSQAKANQRLCGSFCSSFFCVLGWRLTLCCYLINDTIPTVAVVIKSNEVPNGWSFVESAVGNWGGGCLRWASCPYSNKIVFLFSPLGREGKDGNCIREIPLQCTLLFVWTVVLTPFLKVTELLVWKKHPLSLDTSKRDQFIMQRWRKWSLKWCNP